MEVKWLGQAPEHRYQLDDPGSFVLHHCNGHYIVSDIEATLREEFVVMAEPTVNRLVKFLRMLDNNSVISFKENLPIGKPF